MEKIDFINKLFHDSTLVDIDFSSWHKYISLVFITGEYLGDDYPTCFVYELIFTRVKRFSMAISADAPSTSFPFVNWELVKDCMKPGYYRLRVSDRNRGDCSGFELNFADCVFRMLGDDQLCNRINRLNKPFSKEIRQVIDCLK